ncbi:hypothetical protein D3C72_1522690 [compost metagenome]
MALDHGVEQRQHHQADDGADHQVQVQRLADVIQGAVFAFVDEQVPVQLWHQAHVEKVTVTVAAQVFMAAADRLWHLPEQFPQTVQFAQRLARAGTMGTAL